MKTKAVFGCILLFFCLGVIAGIISSPGTAASFDFQHEKMRLARMFTDSDTKITYDYFVTAYAHIDPGTIHELEHYFGSELYKREGLEGIVYCQGETFYGCYHGFIAQALGAEGTGIVGKIDTICNSKTNGAQGLNDCMHGLGHGLMAAGSYTQEQVISSLAACDTVKTPSNRTGCYGGVFMEFNTQTMVDSSHRNVRPYSQDRPYYPCDTVDDTYRESCYFEQPGWWRIVLSDNISRMGAFCDQVTDTTFRRSCFQGLGQIITGINGFRKNQTFAACDAMPSSDGVSYCREKAQEQLTAADTHTVRNTVFNFQDTKKVLETKIRSAGEKKAYEFLVTSYPIANPAMHTVAHWFGEQLYKRSGMEAIAICDNTFAYGCYHGFLTAAVQREGDAVLSRAESACQKETDMLSVAGCMHGIGHGVMATSGTYSEQSLVSALNRCDTLDVSLHKTSCYNGVFMEYNFRTMETPASNGARPYDKNHPYAPCDTLPDAYRQDCYYELPGWWEGVLSDNFVEMGTLCASLTNNDQISCLRGVGRVMGAKSDFDSARSKSICASLSKSGQTFCMIGLVEQRINEGDNTAQSLCNGLSKSGETDCTKRARALVCTLHKICR